MNETFLSEEKYANINYKRKKCFENGNNKYFLLIHMKTKHSKNTSKIFYLIWDTLQYANEN